jgi:predicted transposase/invertase (TIGR01784 family)
MRDKPLISFDYAIKYLLKDKKDYEIIEGFISALLKTQGYNPVKIIEVLDGESNIEYKISKKSIADVVVRDEQNNKYIIEIERNITDSFIEKACFNTSRLIVDHIAQRAEYHEIIKVFHISLLYFSIGNGPISHGKYMFHDIEQKISTTYRGVNTLPEYFIISIPLFDDRLTAEIHEWLYVLKHDEVLESFHSPYMKKVEEKLNFLKMTQDERNEYINYNKEICSKKEAMKYALEKANKEGKLEGKLEEKIAIAKKMLLKNKSIEEIIDFTELTQEEIRHYIY